jgi:hypothetical protein
MPKSAYAVLATTALALTVFTAEIRPAAAEQTLVKAVQLGELPSSYPSIAASGLDTATDPGTTDAPTRAGITGEEAAQLPPV